jgi:(2Fe-2S) ferredoxin
VARVSHKYLILVCRGPECGDKRHSADVHAALSAVLQRLPRDGSQATVDRYSCFGKCERGVNVLVREIEAGEHPLRVKLMPQSGRSHLYHRVQPEEAQRIVDEHVVKGRPLLDLQGRK